MKKLKKLILLSLCTVALLTGCDKASSTEPKAPQEPQEVVSEANQEEPKRVIAGTVASAEILDLIDVDVVGVVSTEKTLPERFDGVAEIGMPMNPDLEKVVSLDPGLYITDASLKESIEALFTGKNIETMFLSNNSYQNILENIESLGQYFDKEEEARAVLNEMKEREQQVLDSIEEKEAPRILVIFGTPESFMLATKHSYAGGLVEMLGGINVTDSLGEARPMPYLPFSLETIADLNPDMILRLTHVSPEVSKAAFEKEFQKGFWANLEAVKNNRVYDLDPEYFGVTANIRAIEALEQMAEILYQ